MRLAVAVSLMGVAGSAASASFLMITDSGVGDRVMLFSAIDGSVVDLNWITDLGAPFTFTTPKEALRVGNEIWVSDQVVDAIHRFDLDRNFLGSVTAHPNGGVLDNLRGMGFDGTKVFLTVFPSTQANRGVAVFDMAGNPTSFFSTGNTVSTFDAEPFQGDLLITNSTTNNLERWSTSGAFLGNFTTGIVFPQQVSRLDDGSVLVVSSISTPGVEGVYHFNVDGSLRTYIDTEVAKQAFGELVPRGAYLLDDGNYLVTASNGVYKTVGAGPNYTFTQIVGGVDAQYVNLIPSPGAGMVMGLGVLAVARRRR